MDALEALGDMLEPVRDNWERAIGNVFNFAGAGGLSSGQFTVNPGNVLAAAKIISSQAFELDDLHFRCRERLRIERPGDDQISDRMAKAWNELLVKGDESYSGRVKQYVEGLKALGLQLQEAAKTYGYTDDQIAAALGKTSA